MSDFQTVYLAVMLGHLTLAGLAFFLLILAAFIKGFNGE